MADFNGRAPTTAMVEALINKTEHPEYTLLQAHAAALHSRGFIPIRIKPNLKEPRDVAWETTHHASASMAAAWFDHFEGNIGVTMPSDVIVIDLDLKNGNNGIEEIARITERIGVALPPTWTATTPSGGQHHFFRLPPGVTFDNKTGIAPGVDIKTKKGQVLVEPSCIDGRNYTWNIGTLDIPMGDMPAQWIDELRRLDHLSVNRHESGTVRRIPEGHRNNELASMAGTMRDAGFAYDAVLAGLRVANATQCDNPLLDIEVARIAKSVTRYEPTQLTREMFAGNKPVLPLSALTDIIDIVDMTALLRTDDDAQGWCWDGYIPTGHVTLLGGHGGAGKSILALHLALCVAMGIECLGRPTQRARTLYYTGEDPKALVMQRLRVLCRQLGIKPLDVMQWLQVVDTTELFPVLFTERRVEGIKFGITTPVYHRLAEYLKEGCFSFVIIDNASDVFDGDEINRSMVRAFIRSLTILAGKGAVLLLAHVDKLTSRAGKQAGTEAYSGSTAWNNSVRSRMLLLEIEPGKLELQHQKCNLGPKMPALSIDWPEGEVMKANYFEAVFRGQDDIRALLALIHEFNGRGEWVPCGTRGPGCASQLLASEATYPRHLKPQDVFALLRDAERQGLLHKVSYRDAYRNQRERWELTLPTYLDVTISPG